MELFQGTFKHNNLIMHTDEICPKNKKHSKNVYNNVIVISSLIILFMVLSILRHISHSVK